MFLFFFVSWIGFCTENKGVRELHWFKMKCRAGALSFLAGEYELGVGSKAFLEWRKGGSGGIVWLSH